MRFTSLRQRGDTMVEVLISIGIVSLTLAVAYATANRNYLQLQDTQERGNALSLLQRQTESLKAFSTLGNGNYGALSTVAGNAPFCMTLDPTTGLPGISLNSNSPAPNNLCLLGAGAAKVTDPNQQPAYNIKITNQGTVGIASGSGTLFKLQASWDSLSPTAPRSTVQLEYEVFN